MKTTKRPKKGQFFFVVIFLCFVYIKPAFCIPQNVQIISVNDVLYSETGYIYLPAKPLGKLYLANYDYNKKEKKLTLSKGKSYITFWLNSTKAERNGETINVKFPVKIIKSQIFVPVREVHHAFYPNSQLDMGGYGITITIGNRVLIADQSQENIYSYSGSFYASAKMWEKALENYKLAQKLNPTDLWIQDYIIKCYFNMENYRTALKEYKKLQAMRIKGKYTLFNSQWDNEIDGKPAIENQPTEKSNLEPNYTHKNIIKDTVPTTISQIQIDDEDNIYILDAQMKRVWKVSPTGKIQGWIGNSDFDTGHIKTPASFTVEQDKTIFIVDNAAHSIFLYDALGNLKKQIPIPEYSKITHENIYLKKHSVPIRIAVTKNNIFILDMNLNWLLQLDMSGNLLKRWDTDKDGTELFEHPLDMDARNDKLFITDGQKKRIVVIGENGVISTFSVRSEKKLNASIPLNLTIDKAGILSVLVFGHQEIMQFDVNGKFLGKRMIRYLDAKDIYDFLFTSTGETVWFLKEKQNENWREWYPVPYTPPGWLLVANKENKLKFSIPSGIAYPSLKDVPW